MHEVRDEVRRSRPRPSAAWSQVPFHTIVATVAIVAAVYLAGKVLYRLRDLVLVVVVAGFIALILNPLVLALQRLGVHRRGLAVAVVTLVAILVFAGLVFAFGDPLVHGLTHFANALPRYVRQAQHGHGWIGRLVRHYHIESWVKKNTPKLVSFAERLTKPVLSIGKGAVSVLLSLLTMFVFVLLLLLEAPKLRVGVLEVLPSGSAERWRHLGAEVARSVSGYMLGKLTTSVLFGLVVLATLAGLSVPFAFLWALWVTVVDFLPEVGGALALIPLVLFALTQSLTDGVVTAVVFLSYWQVENRVLNPVVMSRTVRVNPLLIFVAVTVGAGIGSWVGGTFGGFATALIAIPAAAALQAIVRELWQGRDRPVPVPER